MDDRVYLVSPLDDQGPKRAFEDLRAALRFAESVVGNRAHTKPFPMEDTYCFGPGDGTTTVMVRAVSRAWELAADIPITPKEEEL